MDIFTGTTKDGPWTLAYELQRAQCNRLGLDVPGNTDANDNESSSDESFYFLGHCTNDSEPIWRHPSSGEEMNEHDPQMMANRGLVLKGQGDAHVSRWWKLSVLDANGSHYVGINHFTIFGNPKPITTPESVSVSVVKVDGFDSFEISWAAEESEEIAYYNVIAFAWGIGRGSGGFTKLCERTTRKCIFDGLTPHIPYVFVVVGIDAKGQIGCPSKATKPMTISTSGWVLNELSAASEDVCSSSSFDNIAGTVVHKDPKSEINSGAQIVKEREVSIHPEKRTEMENLKKRARERQRSMTQEEIERFAARYEESIQKVLQGHFSEAEKINVATTVRMFLSSTFDDTTAERNYLMEYAFPIMKSFCHSQGLTFAVVDLRWGVRNEATDDHMTIDVCLGELNRCLQSSTAASFVFLSGERYGWRALPNRVAKEELDHILTFIPEGEAKETITQWYQLDNNHIPPEYILQKISVMRGKPIQHNDFWKSAQDIIQGAIRTALDSDGSISDEVKHNWSISVTEREVLAGLFHPDVEIECNAMVLMRTIEGLEGAVKTSDKAKIYYTGIDADRTLLNALRSRVKIATWPSHFKEFSVPWNAGGISFSNPEHQDYIRQIAAEFVASTQDKIKVGLSKRRLLSVLEREVMHHSSFALKRSKSFVGREDIRRELCRLLESEGPLVRCVHGCSGTGKTSAMCMAAVEARSRLSEKGTVIFRACGTSAASSNALELLVSISMQISTIYGFEMKRYNDFDSQVAEFHQCLSLSTPENPLIIIIDSLDQLSNLNNGRSQPWKWLPQDLVIPHTKILVSTLPDDKYGTLQALKSRVSSDYIVEIGAVNAREAMNVVMDWLGRSGRTLQRSQLASIESQLRTLESVTMLHLRLVHDQILKWKSYDEAKALPTTVSGLINLIFDDLEQLHGRRLVAAIMGLLAASRSGLSEANILDLISGNDDVLGMRGTPGSVLEYHDPPIRRLPPLVFSRLRRDLGDYLVERGENGVTVLNLYHRQFWETQALRYFEVPETKMFHFNSLAEYFSGNLSAQFPERGIDAHPLRFEREREEGNSAIILTAPLGLPNRQKICELAHALKAAGRHIELMRLLCDLRYLEAVFEAGHSYAADLLIDYHDCLLHLENLALQDSRKAFESQLTAFYRFIRKWFHVLCLQPDLVSSLAGNSPSSSDVASAARAVRSEGLEMRPWIEWSNAPNEFDACIQTQMCAMPLSCCAFAPSGNAFAVGSVDCCLVFDTLSSTQICRFTGHESKTEGISFSCDGNLVLSVARESLAQIWSASNGAAVRTLGPHLGWTTACAWSRDSKMALIGCANTIVHVWDPQTGSHLAFLEGHTGPIKRCTFLGNNKAVTGSEDSSAVIWDLTKFSAVTRLTVGSPVNCVDVSPDNCLIAVASDKSCVVWEVGSEGGKILLRHKLDGHVSEVWSCCFSPNSMELVTGAADRIGRIFCAKSGALLGKIQGHLQWVLAVSWAGQKILTASCDRSAKLWERAYVRPASESSGIEERPLAGLRFVEHGRRLRGLTKGLVSFMVDLKSMSVVEERLPPPNTKDIVERKADLCADSTSWAFTSYDNSYRILFNNATVTDQMRLESRKVSFDVANTTVRWHPSDDDRVVTGGHGHAHIVVTRLSDNNQEGHWKGKGWLMDLDWSPDGSGIAAACQDGTLWLQSSGGSRYIASASMSVCVDGSGSRVAAILSEGVAYDVKPKHAVIVDLRDEHATVEIMDPILQHAKLQDRNCRWADDDRLVVVVTAGSSALGCPSVSAYRTADGVCVARFCSPFPSNFACLDIAVGADGDPNVAVVDDDGRIFLLCLRNLRANTAQSP